MINYEKFYQKQYGERTLKHTPKRKFWGFRKLFWRYDWDRYFVAKQFIESGEKILDIGCGDGCMLRTVKDKFDEFYGIDISSFRIKEAKEKTKELYPSDILKFKFIKGNLDELLPFSDNFFDAIVCLAVIEHVYDIFSLVKEISRVLKTDGYVIAVVPNIAYFKHRISLLFGKLPITSSAYNWQEIGWDGGHIHYFTMEKFCWLFESQGFHIEKKSGSGFLSKFRKWWPSLLTGEIVIKARK